MKTFQPIIFLILMNSANCGLWGLGFFDYCSLKYTSYCKTQACYVYTKDVINDSLSKSILNAIFPHRKNCSHIMYYFEVGSYGPMDKNHRTLALMNTVMAVIDQSNPITKLQDCVDPDDQLEIIIPPTNGTFMKEKRKNVKKIDVYFTVYLKKKMLRADRISIKSAI